MVRDHGGPALTTAGTPPRAEPPAERLARELVALLRRIGPWPPSRWGAAGRVDAAQGLAAMLAELAREAGSGAPAGAVPHAVRPHGLADQVDVLGQELLDALAAKPNDEIAQRATAVVVRVRSALGAS